MKYPHHASGKKSSISSSYRCKACTTSIHWDGTVKAYISDTQLDEICSGSSAGHNC
ncbi:MAG: hypothetical protein ACI85J_000821 [Candidatus Poriferisodalaceae bacterium]|jgi:hypothetical protein